MGSRSKIELAYIAGFLDGDGSLMLQVKKRKDGKLKKRFMCTICFYQDSRHEQPLYWIREVLGIGYISIRNDGMTELRVNGFQQVKNILEKLLPFIRFKRDQAEALHGATKLLSQKLGRYITKLEARKLVQYILTIQKKNYVTRNKKTRKELLHLFDLTP